MVTLPHHFFSPEHYSTRAAYDYSDIRISLDIGDARDGGDMSVWRLDQTGRRLGQVPFERDGGVVRFDAETVAADGSVSFFHEIAR